MIGQSRYKVTRGKQGISCVRLASRQADESWPLEKMNDNITPEEETALLSEGHPEDRLQTPTGTSFSASNTRINASKHKYDRNERIDQTSP